MLEKYVQQLHADLAAKGLARFRPGVYLSDEWACPDKEPVIGVPFYLADPKIAELERAINDLEDEREILMYLRHEAGHAMPRIAGKEVKWDKGTAAYEASRSGPAKDLDPATVNRLHDTALQVYAALKLRDYGRVDMRLTADGRIYVIEANPNPWLAPEAELAIAAKLAGRDYLQLIGQIVEVALARYTA